jgi:hypothetical protein
VTPEEGSALVAHLEDLIAKRTAELDDLHPFVLHVAAESHRAAKEELGWVLGRPWAPLRVRFDAMCRWMSQDPVLAKVGAAGADWSGFSDAQLLQLVSLAPMVSCHETFALELIRRRFVPTEVRAAVKSYALSFWMMGGLSASLPFPVWLSMCRYAVYDVSIFEGLTLPEMLSRLDLRVGLYSIVGRWSPRYHALLPREVQEAALVTLWILKPRVGTRHLVYLILSLALECRVPCEWRDDAAKGVHLFAILQLMRKNKK